jgi:hypothetical protein
MLYSACSPQNVVRPLRDFPDHAAHKIPLIVPVGELSCSGIAPACLVTPDGDVVDVAPASEEYLLWFEYEREEPNFGRKGRIAVSRKLMGVQQPVVQNYTAIADIRHEPVFCARCASACHPSTSLPRRTASGAHCRIGEHGTFVTAWSPARNRVHLPVCSKRGVAWPVDHSALNKSRPYLQRIRFAFQPTRYPPISDPCSTWVSRWPFAALRCWTA